MDIYIDKSNQIGLVREKRVQIQDNIRCVIKEENQRSWQKNLFAAWQAKMIHYENNLECKDEQEVSSSLIYTLHSPPPPK